MDEFSRKLTNRGNSDTTKDLKYGIVLIEYQIVSVEYGIGFSGDY